MPTASPRLTYVSLDRLVARPRSVGRVLGLVLAALLFSATADAQDRTAETTLKVQGDDKLSKELHELIKAEDKEQPPSGPAVTLLQRAQAQKQEMEKALRSRGYYGGTVMVIIAGRPVEDPTVLDAIEALPAGGKLPVAITVETGPAYHISELRLNGPPAEAAARAGIDRSTLGLTRGDVADAAAILRTDAEVLRQLQRQGYALAKVAKREATVDHAARTMELDYSLQTGPLAKMGPVTFSGSSSVKTEFLQRRVPYQRGEDYRPEKVDELRDSLTALGLFNSIRMVRAEQLDANGELPISIEVQDRPPRTIGFGASYESTLGFAIGGYWLHRNLFGEGESLRLSAEINRIGANGFGVSGLVDTGFLVVAAFRKPDWWQPKQDFTAQAQAVREVLDAYDREAIIFGVGLERRFTKQLTGRAGLVFEKSTIQRHDEARQHYTLFGIPMALTWDRTDNLLNPTKGFRILAEASPYVNAIDDPTRPFVIMRLTGSTYFDLTDEGRTVIASRASVGIIPGLQRRSIPPDKLFYSGGGGSVRGFAYQTAGPLDRDHNPLGGVSLIEANLELRQRIGESWGVVAFVDAGSAYETLYPNFKPAPRVGAGLGVRYYTDFGPIRADVAVPLNRRPSDDWFGLYVSLGQAF